MDFFTFDDVAVFDTDYAVDDQTGFDTQYSTDQVAVYDTQFTADGMTVEETEVTVDGVPVYDQITVTNAPVYYDPQLAVASAPLYDPQVVVADAPLYNPPLYDPQLAVSDAPLYDPQLTVTQTPLYDPQLVVNEVPAPANPGYLTATPGATDYTQLTTAGTPAAATPGYSVPTDQTYSSTSYQASFQAQLSVDNTPAANASNGPNYQQTNGQNSQLPVHNSASAQHTPTQHTLVQHTPAQYPPAHHTPIPNAPAHATNFHGTPIHGQSSATSASHAHPAASYAATHPPQAHHVSPQGTSTSIQSTPSVNYGQLHPVSSVPSAPAASRPSLGLRPSTFHGGRNSIIHGLNATAQNPMVNTLVTKPIGSLMSLGRKPKAQALMQNLSVSSAGGTVMNMVTSSVKATTDLCTTLVQSGNIAAPDVGTLAVNTVSLAWKAGAYAYHRSGMKKQLAICLHEYCAAGHLELHQDFRNPKQATWQTTSVFHDAKFLLQVYKDIEQYLKITKISDAEMDTLGWRNPVTIYTEKRMPNAIQKLSACCKSFGIRNVTETDLETRINVVSFPHIGVISLTNAFLVESERRRRREAAGQPPDHHLVPVLGRVLSLAAVCGIHEICLSDITLLLGKAPMFETVARARIAALRNHHASHTINTLLFGGSTESAARDFAQQALHFKDQRMLVGRIVAPSTARFDPVWTNARCAFTGPVDAAHPVGTPIYMLAGWARLIVQREPLRAATANTAKTHAICAERDMHGNSIVHAGALGQLTFTVKALNDGTLMAKPRKFDQWDYLGSSNYKQGNAHAKATGEEKHFGGLVGPAHCGCTTDPSKARLTHEWKYSDELGITSRRTVLNSIQHTRELSAEKISILWSSGDWAKGVFWMQTLPQSSYLQGRGECLHCAIENAALAGCPEVIACGGGRVTAAAKQAAAAAAAAAAGHVVRPAPQPTSVAGAVPGAGVSTPVQQQGAPVPASNTTPPPAYTGTVPPAEQKVHPQPPHVVPQAAGGNAVDDKPAPVGKTASVRRKPIGSAASSVAKKPLVQATVMEIHPSALSPVDEGVKPASGVVGTNLHGVVAPVAPAAPLQATPSTKRKPVVVAREVPAVGGREFGFDLC